MEETDKPWHLHVCKHCPYRTTSTLNMCKHVRLHRRKHKTFTCYSSTPERYECEFCEFETALKVNVKEHLRVFHEGKEVDDLEMILQHYQCQNCNFRTNSLLVITRHICNNCSIAKTQMDNDRWFEYKAEGLKWFRCKFCSHETVHEGAIKCHVRTQHTETKDTKSFKHDPVIITHYVGSQNWSECGQVATHRQWSDRKDMKWWKCDQCSFDCKSKYTLKLHISVAHGNAEDINWFKCEQCNYKSPYKYKLKLHCLRRHLANWFKCDQCSFATKVESTLRQHIVTNHAALERKNPENTESEVDWYEYRTLFGFKCFQCKRCSYQARGKAIMRNHITSKHSDGKDVKWFECEHCSYKCIQKSNLNAHVRNMHSSPEARSWFQCEQCPYKSTKKICLQNHFIARHSPLDDVKWFECKYCPYKAKFERELKVHNLRKHTDSTAVKWLKEKQET